MNVIASLAILTSLLPISRPVIAVALAVRSFMDLITFLSFAKGCKRGGYYRQYVQWVNPSVLTAVFLRGRFMYQTPYVNIGKQARLLRICYPH